MTGRKETQDEETERERKGKGQVTKKRAGKREGGDTRSTPDE